MPGDQIAPGAAFDFGVADLFRNGIGHGVSGDQVKEGHGEHFAFGIVGRKHLFVVGVSRITLRQIVDQFDSEIGGLFFQQSEKSPLDPHISDIVDAPGVADQQMFFHLILSISLAAAERFFNSSTGVMFSEELSDL